MHHQLRVCGVFTKTGGCWLWHHDHTVWSGALSYLELDLEPVCLCLLLVDHVGHLAQPEDPGALLPLVRPGIVPTLRTEIPYAHLFSGRTPYLNAPALLAQRSLTSIALDDRRTLIAYAAHAAVSLLRVHSLTLQTGMFRVIANAMPSPGNHFSFVISYYWAFTRHPCRGFHNPKPLCLFTIVWCEGHN